MAFSIKQWTDRKVTRLNAAALKDLEERLSDYTDLVAAGGVELGYVERETDFTQTGAGNSDVTGPSLEVTVTVGSRPIVAILSATAIQNSSASGLTIVSIKEGSTSLGSTSGGLGTAGAIYPCHRRLRLAPTPGSHTYKVNVSQFVTGNSVLKGPASLQIIEV